MTKWISLCFVVVFVIVFLTLIDETEARGGRGGGGGGSRGGGYRIGYSGGRSYRGGSVRVRVRQRVRYSGTSRIYKGSYGYTEASWHNAFMLGTIYGGPRYLRSSRYHRNPSRMPTICKNMYESDDNGTIYNLFYCPRFFEPDDYEYCCGSSTREYCCKYFDSTGRTASIVISVLAAVIILGSMCYYVCLKDCNCWALRRFLSDTSLTPTPAVAYSKPPEPAPVQLNEYSEQPDPGSGPDGSIPPKMDAGYPPDGKPPLPPSDVNQGGLPYQPLPFPPAPDGSIPIGPDKKPPPYGQ